MFSIVTEPFGNSRKISAYHKNGICLEILPDYGAALNALTVPTRDGKYINIIDGYHSDGEAIETGALYKGVFLFPFPNRLKNGSWNWSGSPFEFPINEPARNNALHGLLYNRQFKIEETTATAELAFVHLSYTPLVMDDCYPFDYRIDIEYIITEIEGLVVKTRVTNPGTGTMPFGLGWHPYFTTGSKVNDLILSAPDLNSLEIDGQMIPTGRDLSYHLFDRPQNMGEVNLDTGFEIKTTDRYQIQIFDPEKKLKFTVWQDAGEEGYSYVQIYTPPHRNSIAIEPMTCRANALQTQTGGIQMLEAGNSQQFEWGISFR